MKPECRRQTEPEQDETECDAARNEVAHQVAPLEVRPSELANHVSASEVFLNSYHDESRCAAGLSTRTGSEASPQTAQSIVGCASLPGIHHSPATRGLAIAGGGEKLIQT